MTSDNGYVTFSYDLSAGSIYSLSVVAQAPSFKSGHFVISGACRMEYPTGGLATAAGTTNISTETRTGSLCGDYFYEGDNGTMVQAENIYLFDETNNTVNNPRPAPRPRHPAGHTTIKPVLIPLPLRTAAHTPLFRGMMPPQ